MGKGRIEPFDETLFSILIDDADDKCCNLYLNNINMYS